MCYYRYILLILFYSCQDLIQGQTYNLRGISSYGIKGKGFSFNCQLPADAKVPFFLLFKKSDVEVCRVDPDDCSDRDMTDNRYTCGCINKNKKLYYLNISSLSLSDEGKWKCRDDVDNKGENNSISLPVYYGPENVIISPRPVQVVENMSSEVDCKSDCKPTCSITWYKGSGTTGIILPSHNGRLMLKNIKRKDATYTCQANHTVLPPSSKTLQITVFYGPDYINVQPPIISVVENSTVNITCSSDCNPSCTYKWYKEPSRTESNDNGLLLTNIKRYQDGNYTCHVSNSKIPGLSKTRTVPIIVNYPPIITSIKPDTTTNIKDEGSGVTFSCSVDSRPTSTVTWSRPGGRQLSSTEQQYTITYATCQHTDNYTCTATNGIGMAESRTIPLYVRCIPRVDQSKDTKKSVSVSPGATAELTLHVISWPLPVFTWYRQLGDGSKELVTDFRMRQNNDGLTSTLTIEDVGEDDVGKYVVYVNNSLGTKSTSFNLKVTAEKIKCSSFGTGLVIGITIAIIGVISTSVICIFLHRSGKLIYNANGTSKYQNNLSQIGDSQRRWSGNIVLSDISPVVYESVDGSSAHCTKTTSTTYEGLNEETREQDPNTYHQLNLYQNRHIGNM